MSCDRHKCGVALTSFNVWDRPQANFCGQRDFFIDRSMEWRLDPSTAWNCNDDAQITQQIVDSCISHHKIVNLDSASQSYRLLNMQSQKLQSDSSSSMSVDTNCIEIRCVWSDPWSELTTVKVIQRLSRIFICSYILARAVRWNTHTGLRSGARALQWLRG